MTDVVKDRFFYGGKIQEIGEPVDVESPSDGKSLTDRGLIGPPDEKQAHVPENKMQSEPDNKARTISRRARRS